jgi:hypothetical protein
VLCSLIRIIGFRVQAGHGDCVSIPFQLSEAKLNDEEISGVHSYDDDHACAE